MAEAPRKKRKLNTEDDTATSKVKKQSKEERRKAKQSKKAEQAIIQEPSIDQKAEKRAAKDARKAEKARKRADRAREVINKAESSEPVEAVAQAQNGNTVAPELEETPQDRAQRMKEARVRMIVNGIKQVSPRQRPNAPAVASQQLEVLQNGDSGVIEAESEATKIAVSKNLPTAHKLNGNSLEKSTRAIDQTETKPSNVEINDPESVYAPDSELQSLPQTDIDTYLRLNHVNVQDPTPVTDNPLRPILDFKYLPRTVRKPQAKSLGSYKSPTPVQAATWPHLLAQRDVIGVAETGSGKTLAFGLPCVQSVKNLEIGRKPRVRAVVVAPTRELAIQIHVQLEQLAANLSLKTACVYGGVNRDPQRAALRLAQIVVATPGRLKDFMDDGTVSLKHVKYLVLDEADRMLDTGFEEVIRDIISKCPKSKKGRQTCMFTATWPESVRKLASAFLVNPVRISIGADNPNNELRANRNVKQVVEVLEYLSKEGRLRELVREYSPSNAHNKAGMIDNRILIFCLYKKECARVENMLRKSLSGAVKGIASIHGDMPQALRTAHIEEFKTGRIPVLVATDVASRGLDIPDVRVVINHTFPLTVEDYVHRIGRTGRAGKQGLSITLFTHGDKDRAGALVNVLRAADQEIPEELLSFDLTVKKKEHEVYGRFYREPREGEKTTGTMTVLD